ncbi:MAG: 5-(carboxyamino)imidazole ribonucleotide synthase [Bacteroidota bacterium]
MTLGILGGGQLGRMTAFAALRLGLDVRILTDKESGPSAPFAGTTVADWTDPFVLRDWAEDCDAVTVESEWAPADRLLDVLPEGIALWPSPDTLHVIRHKGRQRDRLAEHGLPQPEYVRAESQDALAAAAERFGLSIVAKRFEGSYDGYGNATCRQLEELDAAWDALAADDGLLVEAFVPFEAELAVQVARRADGKAVVYPVVRSEHRDHRLHAATVPAGISEVAEAEAKRVALAAVTAVGAVGVVTVELFLESDGRVSVNELAPRPHNTGHLWTEAGHTSQYENHVRAVLGWPLGTPDLRVPAACLINVLGQRDGDTEPDWSDALAIPDVTVHVYGKSSVRPARKMGHMVATALNVDTARQHAERAASLIRL